MSEEKENDLMPEWDENEEDVLLQGQMWIYNFFMGNWQKMLFGFGGVLTIVLVHGIYTESVVSVQRDVHSEIALVKNELPEPNQMAQYGLAPMDNPSDTKRMESLRASAKEAERIAGEANGTAAWFAWVEASKIWDRANEPEASIAALKKAVGLSSIGTDLQVTGELLLASAHNDIGDLASAIQVLEATTSGDLGSLEAQALINLAQLYQANSEVDKAKATLDKVQAAPEPLLSTLATLQAQLEG